MADISKINTGVIILGFLIALIATELAIYLLFPSVNNLLAYFMALVVPFMLFVTYLTTVEMMPDSEFLSERKAGFYGMMREMASFMGDSLFLAVLVLPLSLLVVYGLDYFGLTYGGPLIDNVILLAACFLIPLIILLVYFGLFRAAFVSMALSSPEKVANNYEEKPRRYACPQCGSIFSLPTYVCDCGEHYPDAKGNPELVPSVRGTDSIRCSNPLCRKILPVTDQGGRDALGMVCPDCDTALSPRASNTFTATLAGPSESGKTALAFSAISAVKRGSGFFFPYPGSYPAITPNSFVPPYIIGIEDSKLGDRCLAIYDVSGKYFEGPKSRSWRQPQYGQEDAIFFVVDPLSSGGPEKAEMAENDFWQKYHMAAQTSLTEPIRTPLHVVVTHRDLMNGSPEAKDCLIGCGYGRLISSLEGSFSDIHYHICDAMEMREAAAVFRIAFSPVDKVISDAFSSI
jgi:hypothetical protein